MNTKVTDHLSKVVVDEWIILKWTFKERGFGSYI